MNIIKKIRKTFTLIELIVVLSMIMILSTLLCHALSTAVQASESISCTSNIKQMGVVMSIYLDDSKGYLPKHDFGPTSDPQYMKWQDALYTTLTGEKGQYNNYYMENYIPMGIFACPSQDETGLANRYKHYGLNYYVSGKLERKISTPSERMVIMDSNKGNSSIVNNLPENWGLRHTDQTANMLFVDQHVSSREEIDIPTSAWNNTFWGQNLD